MKTVTEKVRGMWPYFETRALLYLLLAIELISEKVYEAAEASLRKQPLKLI